MDSLEWKYPVILSEIVGVFTLVLTAVLYADFVGGIVSGDWLTLFQAIFTNTILYIRVYAWIGVILILLPVLLWTLKSMIRFCVVLCIIIAGLGIALGHFLNYWEYLPAYLIVAFAGLLYTLSMGWERVRKPKETEAKAATKA